MLGIGLFWQLIGRLGLFFLIPKLKSKINSIGPYDKTGILMTPTPEVLWQEQGILFVDYESLAHSLWRSQEFSLFARYRRYISSPVMDFGCGDGSFSSMLFEKVDLGVDVDPNALKEAESRNLYTELIPAGKLHILADSCLSTIICNSVLEHVENLSEILMQFNRLLKPGGHLVFTIPNNNYTKHLAKYFGKKTASLVNLESSHRNMLDPAELLSLVEKHGFRTEIKVLYQPERYTFAYIMSRFLGKRGIGMLSARLKYLVLAIFKKKIISSVLTSINGAGDGANSFLIASKIDPM